MTTVFPASFDSFLSVAFEHVDERYYQKIRTKLIRVFNESHVEDDTATDIFLDKNRCSITPQNVYIVISQVIDFLKNRHEELQTISDSEKQKRNVLIKNKVIGLNEELNKPVDSPSLSPKRKAPNTSQPNNEDDDEIIILSDDSAKNVDEDKDVTTVMANLSSDTQERVVEEKKRIHTLKHALFKISKEIKKCQRTEISFGTDDEFDERAYLFEDRLQRRAVAIFKKICQLERKKPLTGSLTERKLKFDGSRHPALNDAINYMYRHRKIEFPDFQDVLDTIRQTNRRVKLGLSQGQINCEARSVFVALGNLLQKRRQSEFARSLLAFTENDQEQVEIKDPADNDVELERKLNENAKIGQKRIQSVIDEYADKIVKKEEMGTDVEDASEVEIEPVPCKHNPDLNAHTSVASASADLCHTTCTSPSTKVRPAEFDDSYYDNPFKQDTSHLSKRPISGNVCPKVPEKKRKLLEEVTTDSVTDSARTTDSKCSAVASGSVISKETQESLVKSNLPTVTITPISNTTLSLNNSNSGLSLSKTSSPRAETSDTSSSVSAVLNADDKEVEKTRSATENPKSNTNDAGFTTSRRRPRKHQPTKLSPLGMENNPFTVEPELVVLSDSD